MHILIVDQNRSDRDEIRQCIAKTEKHDLHADMAVNATDAREKIRQYAYDYIFINHDLEDMNGINLLKSICNKKTGLNACPVILTIGAGQEPVMMDEFEYGVQDYLVKGNITPQTVALAIYRSQYIFDMKVVCNTVETMIGDLGALRTPSRKDIQGK
jgi:PleD family two-component response regulator|tara:strand:+ start:22 stop:492 length:471 start_codon:yes stop_codon:yes gene_type:complete